MSNISKTILGLIIVIIIIGGIWYGVSRKQKEEEMIKIGAIFSLTGSAAPYGDKAVEGARLAIDEINNKGGINGKKLELILEDTKSDSKEAVTACNKLINVDRVQIILGPEASSLALACTPLANSNKVILFAPTIAASSYSTPDDYTFRNWPTSALLGSEMAKFAKNRLNLENIAILYINNDMGISYKEGFKKIFEELGGNVVREESFEQDTRDVRTQLTKIKDKQPQAICLLGHAKEIGIALLQMKELDINSRVLSEIGIEDPKVIEIAGEIANGVIYDTPGYDLKGPIVQEFNRKYKEKYGKEGEAFAASTYDSVYILAKAIAKAGYDATKIKDELLKIKDFPGVTGLTNFDRNGDVIKPVIFKTIKNGQFVPYEE